MGTNASCYFKPLAFSETQFEGEHLHEGQTISAETLEIFAVVQKLSKSPNFKKKWTKIWEATFL